MAQYLIGPLPALEPGETPGVEAWEVPYYSAAIGGLRRVAGGDTVAEGWMPGPAEGAELYRGLAYERKMHGIARGIREFMADFEAGNIDSELFEDQREDLLDLLDNVIDPDTGTGNMIRGKGATGSGKTAIFATMAAALKYREDPADPVKILILVPTKDLRGQVIGADGSEGFGRFAPDLDIEEQVGKVGVTSDVTVMTYAYFNRRMREGTLTRDMYDALIADEVHEAGGEKTSERIRILCRDPEEGKHKPGIGVSATPVGVDELFPRQVYSRGMLELVEAGRLAPVTARSVQTEFQINELSKFRNRDDFAPEELADLLHEEARNQIIIDEVTAGLAKGKRVLVRCGPRVPGEEKSHSEIIQERLAELGSEDGGIDIRNPYTGVVTRRPIRAVFVSGSNMTGDQRRLLIKAYNNWKVDLDVLVFVDVLKQGADMPIASKIVNGAPSKSAWVMEQVAGRGMRIYRNRKGEIVATELVDIVDRSKAGQVTFVDVLTKDMPQGKRYRPGATIRPPKEGDEADDWLEDIPPEEPEQPRRARPTIDDLADLATWSGLTVEEVSMTRTGTIREAQRPTSTGDDRFSYSEAAFALGVDIGKLETVALALFSRVPTVSRGGITRSYLTGPMVDRVAQELQRQQFPID